MRVDTMDEMKAIADRLKTTVSPNPVMRIRPNGPPVQAYTTPQGPQRDSARITSGAATKTGKYISVAASPSSTGQEVNRTASRLWKLRH